MDLISDRRALHRIPELDRNLPETLDYLRSALEPLPCKVFSPAESALCAFFDCAAWKSWMEQGRTELYDRLEQVCAVQTVYENLLDCGHCYPTEYMAALLRLDDLLGTRDASGEVI